MNCPVCDKPGGITQVAPLSIRYCSAHGFYPLLDGMKAVSDMLNEQIIKGELKADSKGYLEARI